MKLKKKEICIFIFFKFRIWGVSPAKINFSFKKKSRIFQKESWGGGHFPSILGERGGIPPIVQHYKHKTWIEILKIIKSDFGRNVEKLDQNLTFLKNGNKDMIFSSNSRCSLERNLSKDELSVPILRYNIRLLFKVLFKKSHESRVFLAFQSRSLKIP